MRNLITVCAVALLADCGGSNDGGNGGTGPTLGASGICMPVGGGNSTVTATPATLASFSDAEAAFDGSLDSFTTLETPGGTGISTIRGTMQPGTVQASGSYPGVYFRGSISSNLKVTVTTYLEGAVQESGPALSTVNSNSDIFYGRQVSSSFDAIEIEFNLSGDDSSIEIFELCLGDKNFEMFQ